MKQSEALTLYEYNYWANHKILAAASKVSPQQLTTPKGFPFGSLRGTLVHTMDAEYGWRMLFESAPTSDRWEASELLEKDFTTLDAIESRWREEEASMRRYLARLDDESMTQIIRYTTDEGIKRERVLWHCLFHVVNHGSQHRSEAAAMLTEYGSSPADLDFTVFLNEQP